MTQLTERSVRVGARDLHVATAGNGTLAVLLHGGGPGASGVANWSRNIDALAQHFTLAIPDLPGYGRSSKRIEQDDPFGDLASAVRGLIEALGHERAHLVGNSYGGAAALRLALDRPDRVDRLVLNGPGGVGTTRALPTKGLNALLNYYGGDGPSREKMSDFIRGYLVADAAAITDDVIEDRYAASLDPEVMANPPLRRPRSVKTARRMDFTRDARLARCETPTLVVWGSQDAVNRPSGAWRLARTMPKADVYLAAEVGHWVQWEAPELFNRLALDFLRGRR